MHQLSGLSTTAARPEFPNTKVAVAVAIVVIAPASSISYTAIVTVAVFVAQFAGKVNKFLQKSRAIAAKID